MNTIIEGLHTCKPKNAPQIGAIKAFILEDRGDWTKVRSPKTKDGEVGVPYKILNATKTDYSDQYGNCSYNLELEKTDEKPSAYQQAKQTMQQPRQDAPKTHEDAQEQAIDPILETRQHLMRACNLYNLCVDAVNSAIVPYLPEGARMSQEQLQSTLASIWIEASSRRNTNGVDWWSYIDKMPIIPIKKQQQPEQSDEPPF